MAKRIFINYRRDDAEGEAGRLHDRVARHAGARNVFWDRDDLGPGEDFIDRIAVSAARVDIVLAVIGPEWASPTNLARLHQEDDWVRRELEAGLRSAATQVVPVLVRGAKWPPAGALPASLQPLTARQAWPIRADQFNIDVSQMLRRLNVANRRARAGVAALAVLVLAAVAIIGGLALRGNGETAALDTTSSSTTATTSTPTTAAPTSPPTTSAPTATTSAPTAAPTTTAEPTTTTDPGCTQISGSSLPVEALNVDITDGDFDGDGRLDQMFAYNVAGSPDISRFLVQLGTGYTYEFVDDVFAQLLPPEFLGTLDIDQDGSEEAFVRYAGGASTNTVRVLTFFECRLATLGEFLVGGSIGAAEGLACPFDNADLIDYDAVISDSFETYIVSWERLRIVGDMLEVIDVQPGVEVPLDDPLVSSAYQLDCGNLGQ